jgi:hypothetical protein
MYMNNLTSTYNNLPLTQLSEPLFSTGYEPSLISSASTVPLSISLSLEMSTKDLFKHPQGTFERLTSTNYASWKNNMTRLLQALGVWKVINGTEVRPHDPVRDEYFDRQGYFDRDAFEYDVRRAHRKIEKFEALCATANAALYNACSVSVRVYIDAIESPSQIWTTLQQRLDSTSTSIGRQALYSAFSELRPKPGAPIGDYFSQLLEIRNQIVGTNEAISDAAFKTHLFKTLPPVFAITAKIQQNRTDNPSIEQIIDALKQDEAARSIETLPDAATEAFHSAGPARRHGGKQRYNRVPYDRGSKPSGSRWCTICENPSHTTEDCWYKESGVRGKRSPNIGTDQNSKHESMQEENLKARIICFHCGGEGHRATRCSLKIKGEEARARYMKDKDQEGKAYIATGSVGHGEKDAGTGY